MGISWNEHAWEFQTFVKQIATTVEEGQALWNIIQNKHIYYEGKQIPTGSFRWNANVIASVVGGDYMDYYCASEASDDWGGFQPETKVRIEQKLADLKYELKDND